MIDSVKGCTQVNGHKSSHPLTLHSPEDVIDNFYQGSFTAIVSTISTLIVRDEILVLAMLIKLLEYSTFHHTRQTAKVTYWSEVA